MYNLLLYKGLSFSLHVITNVSVILNLFFLCLEVLVSLLALYREWTGGEGFEKKAVS